MTRWIASTMVALFLAACSGGTNHSDGQGTPAGGGAGLGGAPSMGGASVMGGAGEAPATGGHAGTPAVGGSAGTLAPGGNAGSLPAGGSAGTLATGGNAGSLPAGGSAGMAATGGNAGSSPAGGSAGTAGAGGSGGNCTGVFQCLSDGCCPYGCDRTNDPDCSNLCGDGIVAPNEACDDGNKATEACAYGQYSCNVCAAGCVLMTGATSYCGDFRIDDASGEHCDRNCPTSCADLDVCTTDALAGSGCTLQCTHTPVTACTSGDGCCPPGCSGTDRDCGCVPTGLEVPNDGIDNDCIGGDLVPSDAAGVFVAKTGLDTNPGTMVAPMLTIGAAMTAARAAGKVVFVAEGPYSEAVVADVSLFGGYEAIGWTRDLAAHPTEVTASGYTVVMVQSTATGPVAIDGLLVRGLASNCNAVEVRGVGVAASITRNRIRAGGCSDSTGLEVFEAAVAASNNLIDGGTGSHSHVGITVESRYASAVVANNLIQAGVAGTFSRAVEVLYTAHAVFVNNLLDSGVGSYYSEPQIVFKTDSDAELALIHNDLWRTSGPVTCLVDIDDTPCLTAVADVNGCAWTGCGEAAGNFTGDPLLTGAFPDLRIGATGACVDAGVDPSAYGLAVASDLFGHARPLGVTWDVGAEEIVP